MPRRNCIATNKNGDRCGFPALKESEFCYRHDSTTQVALRESQARGGQNKSARNRAYNNLPDSLKSTLDTLYRALGAVESGEMEPARAQALASLARAITVVFQTGDAERRIADIEKMLAERDAA